MLEKNILLLLIKVGEKIKKFRWTAFSSKKITLDDLVHEKITKKISISTDKLSNITTISLKSVNPDLEINSLEKVHKIADDILKKSFIKKN